MAKQYRVTPMIRFFNRLMQAFIRRGRGPEEIFILTVDGRKTGRPRSTPVSPIEDGDRRYLVAPYGEVEWVKNARAAGQVTLTRGGRSEILALREFPPEERAPILKQYLQRETFPRPYFDAAPDDPLAAFAAEAAAHPVFPVEPRPGPAV